MLKDLEEFLQGGYLTEQESDTRVEAAMAGWQLPTMLQASREALLTAQARVHQLQDELSLERDARQNGDPGLLGSLFEGSATLMHTQGADPQYLPSLEDYSAPECMAALQWNW